MIYSGFYGQLSREIMIMIQFIMFLTKMLSFSNTKREIVQISEIQ
jgi:hypothetical protein